mgnify:CR=1 FL=1
MARWPKGAFGLRDSTTTKVRYTDGVLDVRNVFIAQTPSIFTTASGGWVMTDSVARNITRDAAATTASLFTTFTMPATSATSFDWAPAAGSPLATGGLTTFRGRLATSTAYLTASLTTFSGNLATAAGTFVTGTAYRGAAAPSGTKWWLGWTDYAIN